MCTYGQCQRAVGQWVQFSTPWGAHRGIVRQVTQQGVLMSVPRTYAPQGLVNGSNISGKSDEERLDLALAAYGYGPGMGYGRPGYGGGYGAPGYGWWGGGWWWWWLRSRGFSRSHFSGRRRIPRAVRGIFMVGGRKIVAASRESGIGDGTCRNQECKGSNGTRTRLRAIIRNGLTTSVNCGV